LEPPFFTPIIFVGPGLSEVKGELHEVADKHHKSEAWPGGFVDIGHHNGSSDWVPSGKRLHSYGKPPFLGGKSTILVNFTTLIMLLSMVK